MNFLEELLSNRILLSSCAGWCIAQVIKTIIHLIMTREFVAERLVGGGGMPSSHSATVCALSTATLIQYGVGSFEFAMAFTFSVIVMYDAMGVRRETGIHSKVLNELVKIIEDLGSDMSPQDKLREFIGHTPLQVVIGAILGILIAIVTCLVL